MTVYKTQPVGMKMPSDRRDELTGRQMVICTVQTVDVEPVNALISSIARYGLMLDYAQRNDNIEIASIGVHDDPLCVVYYGKRTKRTFPPQAHCVGCPVMAKTGNDLCVGAPAGLYTSTNKQVVEMLTDHIAFLEELQ